MEERSIVTRRAALAALPLSPGCAVLSIE